MPTPVGHALGGLAVYVGARGPVRRAEARFAALVVAAALLPDLDFAIGPFAGRSYHHYFTHSLGFTLLILGASLLLARAFGRVSPRRDALLLAAAYLSHLALDLLAKDPSPPFGIQLFWPWSDGFTIAPVTIFTDVWRGSLALLLGPHNWAAVGLEILVLGPVVGLLWWARTRQSE